MAIFIVYLDELYFRELFEVGHQRARNRIESAIRLAITCQIDVRDTIGIFKFAVACEAIEHKRQSLIAFHVAGPFEIFIEHRADQILSGGDEARRTRLIWKLSTDQAVVVCEIDIHLHIKRGARGCWRSCDGWRNAWSEGGRDGRCM